MRNRSILDITLAIIGVLAIVFFVPALDFHNLNEKKKIVRIFSDGCVCCRNENIGNLEEYN